jgi:dTDP-glucose 4,6-dehydratase
MKLLVTGGAGFIGSHFLRYILKARSQIEVINFDLLTYAGNLENLSDIKDNPRYKFVKGDILDNKKVESLLKDCNGIINFAAESHVDRSILGPEAFVQTNVVGAQRLLELAKKNKIRFVQVSTDEVYGSLGDKGQFTESSPLEPNSPYSASKAAADLMCRAYFHTYNADVVVTRCSNNYGPFQFPEKLIPLMISNARSDKSLPVYGDGLHVRDWIYVEDHCSAILDVFEKGKAGEVYNIGANNEWPNLEIVKKILKDLKKPESLIGFVKDRPGHDRRYALDSSKIQKALGWKPKMTFEMGLQKTISWYVENEKWLKNLQTGAYQKYYETQYGR